MSWPTADPKRLRVIDRIVTVLKSVCEGDNYFSTFATVGKRIAHEDERIEHPYIVVYGGGSAGSPVTLADNYYDEDAIVFVEGEVAAEDGDSTTPAERCLRDVRRAIDQDYRSTASGSLGSLCKEVHIDTAEIATGPDFGWFRQRLVARVTGEWGDI